MYNLALNATQHSQLRNSLVVAAEKYAANAKLLREMKPQLEAAERDDPDSMRFIHSSACEGMAEGFGGQEAMTREILELVDVLEEAS